MKRTIEPTHNDDDFKLFSYDIKNPKLAWILNPQPVKNGYVFTRQLVDHTINKVMYLRVGRNITETIPTRYKRLFKTNGIPNGSFFLHILNLPYKITTLIDFKQHVLKHRFFTVGHIMFNFITNLFNENLWKLFYDRAKIARKILKDNSFLNTYREEKSYIDYISVRYYDNEPDVVIETALHHSRTSLSIDFIYTVEEGYRKRLEEILKAPTNIIEYHRTPVLNFFLWTIDEIRRKHPTIKYGAITIASEGSNQLFIKLIKSYGYSDLIPTVENQGTVFAFPPRQPSAKRKKEQFIFALCRMCINPPKYICGQCKDEYYCSEKCAKDHWTQIH